ncbi:lysophospholipid acyltransferase family protein [Dyadobacter sp. 32]|uniref:GNAT family N-acyltransferase n=1 Tax=Dyadobacter sp. 32 TaxID=538966 RepID=UPI0011EBDF32
MSFLKKGKTDLVTASDIAKAIRINRFGLAGNLVASMLMKILRIDAVNKVYDKTQHLKGVTFLNEALHEFDVQYQVSADDLNRLPKDGAYITVSNHPLGGIDGILLLKVMLELNPNYKILANFLLDKIVPMKPHIFPVNPFKNYRDSLSNVNALKDALLHLHRGNPLGIFPAGEVSTLPEMGLAADGPWDPSALRLIRKAQVPVIPIYFHATNSPFFYLLAKLGGNVRTAMLPFELFSQKNRLIKIRIGRPISVARQNELGNISAYSDFLRKKTYMLAKAFNSTKTGTAQNSSAKTKAPLVPQTDPDQLRSEILNLRASGHSLLTCDNYEVFLAKIEHIPSIMRQIGILREITFREAGEGTNQATDTDRYDAHYHHLFLWDEKTGKIAGAYRVGLGSDIFSQQGTGGFYLSELFDFAPEFSDILRRSIELGRAFVTKEYQKRTLPLFLLWKGILHLTLRSPQHQFLLGGVSVSDHFCEFSKSLMIDFMKCNYYQEDFARWVKPKNEYRGTLNEPDRSFLFEQVGTDLNRLDQIVQELEPESRRVPVLIKKYIKQNARFVAFNVDPSFSNVIDGLMCIKIADIPRQTIEPVKAEYKTEFGRRDNIMLHD